MGDTRRPVCCGIRANRAVATKVEGGILQSLSWAIDEKMTFDESRRTGLDWGSYPILRFDQAPGSIEIDVMDRPHMPAKRRRARPLPRFPNAIADGTGVRLRAMPLTPARLKAAIGVEG